MVFDSAHGGRFRLRGQGIIQYRCSQPTDGYATARVWYSTDIILAAHFPHFCELVVFNVYRLRSLLVDLRVGPRPDPTICNQEMVESDRAIFSSMFWSGVIASRVIKTLTSPILECCRERKEKERERGRRNKTQMEGIHIIDRHLAPRSQIDWLLLTLCTCLWFVLLV